MTKNGIEMNLQISPYKVIKNGIEFHFSSKLYKKKFLDKLESYQEYVNDSLSNRFGVSVDFGILASIVLYSNIEKRGFLITYDGVGYKWLNQVKLSYEKLTQNGFPTS